jgi:hypothetical protein
VRQGDDENPHDAIVPGSFFAQSISIQIQNAVPNTPNVIIPSTQKSSKIPNMCAPCHARR